MRVAGTYAHATTFAACHSKEVPNLYQACFKPGLIAINSCFIYKKNFIKSNISFIPHSTTYIYPLIYDKITPNKPMQPYFNSQIDYINRRYTAYTPHITLVTRSVLEQGAVPDCCMAPKVSNSLMVTQDRTAAWSKSCLPFPLTPFYCRHIIVPT